MRLDEVMNRNPVVIHPQDKVIEAARQMRDRRSSAALVVEDGVLVGIVTERDFAYKLVAEGRSPDAFLVSELMTATPVTTTPAATVWEAASRMTVKGIRHLPVCEGDRPVGLVSSDDLAVAGGPSDHARRLLSDLDERSRARVAEVLVWALERLGLRSDAEPGSPREE